MDSLLTITKALGNRPATSLYSAMILCRGHNSVICKSKSYHDHA